MDVGQALRNEYQAAIQDVAWAQVDAGVLQIGGQDRIKWLHKLITAQITDLGVGQGVRSALLDAKGHFVADFDLWLETDSIGIILDIASLESLERTLRRYIIREKVIVRDDTPEWCLFTLIGPEGKRQLTQFFGQDVSSHLASTSVTENVKPHQFVTIPTNGKTILLFSSNRAQVPSIDVLVPVQQAESMKESLQAVVRLGPECLELLRVEAGIPKWGVDFDEHTLALEIPQVMQIRVDQGCYVGQEVVARIVHRGHVNRHLRGLRINRDTVPPRGAPVWHAGSAVGNVTSAVCSPAFGAMGMGYVRREVEVGTEVQIGDKPDVTALVTDLPFVTSETDLIPY